MYQCNHCKQYFMDEPLYSITNDLVYCSYECIPEEATDHPYSFEYFNLISSYRYFTEEMKKVDSLSVRVDLENEMELVVQEYKSIYWGDTEGLYYKGKIMELYEKLQQLYQQVHDSLLHNDEVYYAVVIRWEEIINSIGVELTTFIFEDLLDEMNTENILYKSMSWCTSNEDKISPSHYIDIICFYSAKEQGNFYNTLEKVLLKHQSGDNPLKKVLENRFMTCYITHL